MVPSKLRVFCAVLILVACTAPLASAQFEQHSPLVMRDFYNYTSTLYIMNGGDTATTADVYIYNLSGTLQDSFTTASIAPRATVEVDLMTRSLPTGGNEFSGSARISCANPLAVVARHRNANTSDSMESACEFGIGDRTFYLPWVATDGTWDEFGSLNIRNCENTATNVTISFYEDNTGSSSPYTQTTYSLPANGNSQHYLPGWGTTLSPPLPASNWHGCATVTSDTTDIEVNMSISSNTHKGHCCYRGVPLVGTEVWVPTVFTGSYWDGFRTDMFLMNTTGTDASVTLDYYQVQDADPARGPTTSTLAKTVPRNSSLRILGDTEPADLWRGAPTLYREEGLYSCRITSSQPLAIIYTIRTENMPTGYMGRAWAAEKWFGASASAALDARGFYAPLLYQPGTSPPETVVSFNPVNMDNQQRQMYFQIYSAADGSDYDDRSSALDANTVLVEAWADSALPGNMTGSATTTGSAIWCSIHHSRRMEDGSNNTTEAYSFAYSPSLKYWSLNRSACSGGSITSGDTGIFYFGQQGLNVSASPDSGHSFAGWADGGCAGTVVSTNASYDFSMPDRDYHLYAVFATHTPTATPTSTHTPTATPTSTLTYTPETPSALTNWDHY